MSEKNYEHEKRIKEIMKFEKEQEADRTIRDAENYRKQKPESKFREWRKRERMKNR